MLELQSGCPAIKKSEYFGCHPCINTSSLRFQMVDLMEKVIPTMGHEPVIVELGEQFRWF